ncbi:Uncharacterised protein [Enterobacter cloacae]|jgi:hypothetical protein|nr:Uncharacterised protein [Enterobacter cloacae]
MNNNPVGAKCNIFPFPRAGNPPSRAPNCELIRKVPGAIAILMVYNVKLICKLTARLLRKSLAVLM